MVNWSVSIIVWFSVTRWSSLTLYYISYVEIKERMLSILFILFSGTVIGSEYRIKNKNDFSAFVSNVNRGNKYNRTTVFLTQIYLYLAMILTQLDLVQIVILMVSLMDKDI